MREMILKNGTRILTPSEVDSLFDSLCEERKCKHKWYEIFNALLYTGMRYVELQRFHEHPEWFLKNRMVIHLPREATKKKKRVYLERYVYLSSQGMVHITNFLKYVDEIPSRTIANKILRSAGASSIGEKGLSAKTFRKTWESWLVASYPNAIPIIMMSQGHTDRVSIMHYLNIPFTREERREIEIRTAGWSGVDILSKRDKK